MCLLSTRDKCCAQSGARASSMFAGWSRGFGCHLEPHATMPLVVTVTVGHASANLRLKPAPHISRPPTHIVSYVMTIGENVVRCNNARMIIAPNNTRLRVKNRSHIAVCIGSRHAWLDPTMSSDGVRADQQIFVRLMMTAGRLCTLCTPVD